MDKVVSVADDDEWELVGQLGLFEKVFDTFRVVDGRLAADPLHLLDLTRLAGGLDVLEVYLGILAEVDDAAEEIEEALEGLEGLEKVDESVGRKLFVVFGSNLDTDLKMKIDCVSKM